MRLNHAYGQCNASATKWSDGNGCLRRPALTEAHAAARLQWALRYQHFTYLNWRRVRWSDECSIQLGKGRKRGWVFAQAGKEQLERGLVEPRRCGKAKSKMFWAAFGHGVRTHLIPLEGDPLSRRRGVTAHVYKAVLDTYLLPILGDGGYIHAR